MLAPNSILVVKNRALGDALIGLSGLAFLREQFPQAKITYAVPLWMMQVFRECDLIDDVIALDLKNVSAWVKTYQSLMGKNFDLIIEFNQSGRSGHFFKLYSLLNSIPYFFHNHNMKLKHSTFVHDQGVRKPNTQRDLDLVYSVLKYYKVDSTIPEFKHYPLEFNKISAATKRQIVFGVVATRETKLWPIEHFKELALLIEKMRPDLKIIIPISNNPLDQRIKTKIKVLEFPKNCEAIHVPLKDLKNLLQGSLLYIGNDTGIKHFCISLNIPSVSFFGPEEPYEWHPYDKIKHPYFFIEPLECRTKLSHFCGIEKCEVMACLKPITPQMVLQKVSELLPRP